VAVIAAGEMWPGGELRPALEDLLGAGAILAGLPTHELSVEARTAAAIFNQQQGILAPLINDSVSGRELIEIGFGEDVRYACELDASMVVPVWDKGAFQTT
jgi:2-phosphosulfolactate phosphatase